MPTALGGEKRPADVIANAVLSMKIATGDAEKWYVDSGKSAGGRKGGKARAEASSGGAMWRRRLPRRIGPIMPRVAKLVVGGPWPPPPQAELRRIRQSGRATTWTSYGA